MTLQMDRPGAVAHKSHNVLTARLAELESERADVAVEAAIPQAAGDVADRSHNVDALIRLASLERHIEEVQIQLQNQRVATRIDGVAGPGSTVWLRFDGDDESEPYLIGTVEQAASGDNVVTPASPLGRAVLNTKVGDHIEYEGPGRRRTGATVTRVVD